MKFTWNCFAQFLAQSSCLGAEAFLHSPVGNHSCPQMSVSFLSPSHLCGAHTGHTTSPRPWFFFRAFLSCRYFWFQFFFKKKKWNAGPVLTRGQVLQTWTRGTSKCVVAQSCPTLCDPWTVACQAPLSMEFSRQEDEWVAMPFCRGFSWPRDQTWVFCIAERFFTVTTEATPGWTRDVTSRHSEFKWHPDPSSRTPAPAEGALPGSLFSWPPRKSQTVLKILTEC